jgi:hypothetical protein
MLVFFVYFFCQSVKRLISRKVRIIFFFMGRRDDDAWG